MMPTPRLRFPVWLLSCAILVGELTMMTAKEKQISTLAEEAKEFYWQLDAEVSYT